MKRLAVMFTLAMFVFGIPAACFANDGFFVSFDLDSKTVTASGADVHVISDSEKEAFDITEGPLKDAVKAHFGKRPNDAYLHSSTPWGDLYKSYNWPQVTTTLKIISAQVLSTNSHPAIVSTITFDNTQGSDPYTYHAKVWEQVSNTEEHSWSSSDSFTVSQSVKYGTNFGGQTTASYTHAWGKSHTQSQTINVGLEAGVDVTVKPGEQRIVNLTASLGTMKVRVKYQASLSGDVATNYNPTYKDHHFWRMPVADVLRSAGRPSVKEITEDVEISFYSNATVQVIDPSKHHVLESHPAMIVHH